jgi:hypothetical protein
MARYPLGVLVLVVALAGCSVNSQHDGVDTASLPSVDRAKYSGVHAKLDPATASISLPMDAYEATPDESMVITAANMFVIEECMKKAGVPMPEKHGDLTVKADQSYGVWVPELAANYGYDKPIIRTVPGIYDSKTRESADANVKKYFECDNSTVSSQIPPFRSRIAGQDSLLTNISNDSNALSEGDPEWSEARNDWIACLKEAGISMRQDSPDAWVPSYPSDKQGEIRTAVQDANCKQETNVMQRIMDIRAQYQSALIATNQAAMNRLAEEKTEALANARTILRQHGKGGA